MGNDRDTTRIVPHDYLKESEPESTLGDDLLQVSSFSRPERDLVLQMLTSPEQKRLAMVAFQNADAAKKGELQQILLGFEIQGMRRQLRSGNRTMADLRRDMDSQTDHCRMVMAGETKHACLPLELHKKEAHGEAQGEAHAAHGTAARPYALAVGRYGVSERALWILVFVAMFVVTSGLGPKVIALLSGEGK